MELSVHVVTTFLWQAVMFYFNSHISPLQFPLTGWNFTSIPRGCHFVSVCWFYPSSGNSPLHTPCKNLLHPITKATDKTMVFAGTMLGFSFSCWMRKGQAVRGWILMASWTHTGNFSWELTEEMKIFLRLGWHSHTSRIQLEMARFVTHDAHNQSCLPY